MRVAFVQGEQFVGQTIGSYTLERLIGQGQWNAVYQAQQRTHRRSVLLTLYFLPPASTTQARQRFMTRLYQEGKQLIQLQHPHILPTLDVGEHSGYPFLVMPTLPGNTLVRLLKHQGPFSPQQTLEIVKPLAAALDYAHAQGVIHGALSSANLILDTENKLQVIRFGANRLSMLQGFAEHAEPHSHLLSIAGTPLPALDYMAPEIVLQGRAADVRTDVYALGILLFELLSGSLPFQGNNTIEHAQKHAQMGLPSFSHAHQVPDALQLVVQLAVKRDTAQRIPSAGQVAKAFERALSLPSTTSVRLPATTPPIRPTFKLPTITPTPVTDEHTHAVNTNPTPLFVPPASPPIHITPTSHKPQESSNNLPSHAHSMDPFAWWESTAALQAAGQESGTFSNTPNKGGRKTKKAPQKERRQVVALLAVGSVLTLGIGGIGLARVFQGSQNQQPIAKGPNNPQSTSTSTPMPTQSTKTPKPTATPTEAKPTPTQAQATPTPVDNVPPPVATQPPKQPTKPPAPTPTPTPSAGTVIGNTSLGVNQTKYFTNPDTGAGSLLIHLPGDNFVAYEVSCTHQGTEVYYDGAQRRLVCPSHGALFDPTQNGKAVKGPATDPLNRVAIRINGNGTITAGS